VAEETTYFDFNLRPQQKSTFLALQNFVRNDKAKIFILKGYAGTGKTTLMSGLIKWLDQKEYNFTLLASTGRAAKILSDKTNTKAKTIHSHIYVFKDLDDDLETISKQQEKLNIDDKGQISLMFDLKTLNSESVIGVNNIILIFLSVY